jgi:hypothetical protein
MKTILISLMTLLSSGALAMGDTPDTFCDGAFCTPQMREVVASYVALSTPPALSQAPAVLSGECWSIYPGMNPTQTNHALFLMENTLRGFWSRGLFSFFAPSNPYAGYDVEMARNRLNVSSGPGAPVTMNPDHATWSFPGDDSDIKYWVRTDGPTGKTILISRWMYHASAAKFADVRMFCWLNTH